MKQMLIPALTNVSYTFFASHYFRVSDKACVLFMMAPSRQLLANRSKQKNNEYDLTSFANLRRPNAFVTQPHVELTIDPTKWQDNANDDDDISYMNESIQGRVLFPPNTASQSLEQPPRETRTMSVQSSNEPTTNSTVFVTPATTNINATSGKFHYGQANDEVIIAKAIKQVMFRYFKFFDREQDYFFNTEKNTFCGLLLTKTNQTQRSVNEQSDWWLTNRRFIKTTHTNHRNNCIKMIQLKYKGKFKCIVDFIFYHE